MVGKTGDQALRRAAFQEAIVRLGKAIAIADKTGGGKVAGASGERGRLQVAYGHALNAARGAGVPGADRLHHQGAHDAAPRSRLVHMSPFNAFLTLQGIETVALRMERHCANTSAVAAWLDERPEIAKVFHPSQQKGDSRRSAEK
jgi:Cys/Met metabolism PLP-dependent enzyme